MRIDAGGYSVGGVVEAIDEFKAQGDEERDPQKNVGIEGSLVYRGQIIRQCPDDIEQTTHKHYEKKDKAPLARAGLSKLLV
jgi:hypothetical protein